MKFSYFKRWPIKLLSAAIFIIVVAILLSSGVNIFPLNGRGKIQGYKLNQDIERVSANLNTYDMQVEFRPDRKEIRCIQKLEYKNRTSDTLDRIFFHIYPNAFKYEEKVPFPADDMRRAYPNGFSPGGLDILSIQADGKPLEYIIRGYSEEILEVQLPKDISPDQQLQLTMEFKVDLPNCLGRSGYGDNTFNITDWYPILCVYDEGGWKTYPYFPIGDPFYSEVANYRVQIISPKEYEIASTGNILSIEEEGDNKVWSIEALAVRDFALVASDKFMIDKKKVGSTMVYSYHLTPKAGKQALKYASDAIKVFNKRFGKYPYNQFTVVEADFYIGGMEYPNLVLIDQSLYRDEAADYLELITVHETAHQWWYGVVGSNQIEEAWLDEGLTEYSTLLYYKDRYNKKKMEQMSDSMIGRGKYNALSTYTQGKEIDETIARPVYRFPDWIVYDLIVYGKGAMIFDSLNAEVGDRVFNEILNNYYEKNMFKNATLDDLLSSCYEITEKDYTQFFSDWLYDK